MELAALVRGGSWALLHAVWVNLKRALCSFFSTSLQSCVSFSLAAHSQYGTDDRVKLPNLTDEEVNWQGLEDLYSINESLYECRPDYSPSPDNWANFQKDVDNMFALRHVFNKFNRTHKLDDSTLPELGSGAGGGGFEEGSGEELASASDVWPGPAAEARLTTPAPSKTPSSAPPTPRPIPERKLESVVNDLPERLKDRPGVSVMSASPVTVSSSGPRRDKVVFQSDMWAQQLEDLEGQIFSGNGLTELETRHYNQMELGLGHGEATGPQGLGLGLDPEEEEDIFQAQGYLPFSPQTLRPKVQDSTTGSPTTTQTSTPRSVGVVLQTLPQSALPLTLDYEGSGSLPQPSNQTLWGRCMHRASRPMSCWSPQSHRDSDWEMSLPRAMASDATSVSQSCIMSIKIIVYFFTGAYIY